MSEDNNEDNESELVEKKSNKFIKAQVFVKCKNTLVEFVEILKGLVFNKYKIIQKKITNFLKTNFINLKNKYNKRKELKKQKYDSLAPKDNIKDSATVDMLRKALKEKKNRNVALSGKYGSGKSSIVLSALKNQKKFKPLYISLGMLGIQEKFIEDENKEKNTIDFKEENVEIISRTIEKSIIQQIIYKERSNKFPASRIKRIPYVNKLIIFFIILLISFSKIEIIQRTFKKFFNIIIEKCGEILLKIHNNPINIIIKYFNQNQYLFEISKTVILFMVIYLVSKYVVSFIRKYSLKNIKLMFLEENEIEICNTEESLINKYMDELVYFFEMTNYNLIIIEDLDRFLENQKLKPKILIIFQKLKELNQILNTSKQLHGRKITFLYVMCDDLFYNEEERTKFFDFIVPKIPEISSYNSYAKLRKIFSEKEISNKFLQQLSTYIKDYRVIKNLKNEFNLYKQEITGKGIIKEKLLGILALKNLRPKEYEELIKEEGELYKFIKEKKQLYQNKESNLKEKIQNNRELIVNLEKDKIKNLQELKYLALGNIACLNASNRGYGNTVDREKFLSDSFDVETIEYNVINIPNYDGYYFSEEQLFKSFGGKPEFIKRAKRIVKNSNDEIKNMKEELKILENNVENLHKLKICELLNEENVEIEKLDEFEIMMLKNGYIDENYKDYCFKYEETEEIKRNDLSYILNVRQDRKTSYDFDIEKPKNVIKELDELFFEKKVIWNYKILDELIMEKESKKLQSFIDTLLEINNDTYDFIVNYIVFSKDKNEFLKLLYTRKKEIIYELFNYGIQNGQDEDELVELLLNIPEILTEENLKESIVEYIIERVGSDVWFELNDNVKKSLKLLEIEFSKISDVENNIELLEFVYENNLYELNDKMIKCIFIYKGFESTDFEQNALSLILKSNKLEKLKIYVLENKEQFIRKCFVNTNGMGNNIDDLIVCLNTWDIEYELKNIIVSKIHGRIDDISKITDTTIYSSILENDKMEISWENIYKIYCAKEQITEELIKYIQKNMKTLENKKILFTVLDSEKGEYLKFRGNIARNNSIEFDIYKKLVGKLNIYINTIEENEIENQRLEILIKEKILRLNVSTFNIVKIQKNDSIGEFVSLNIEDFIKYIDEIDLDIDTLDKIILSTKIKNKYKTIILSKINMELLSTNSIKYIIDNYKKTGISSIPSEMKQQFLNSNISIESKVLLLNKELEKNIDEIIVRKYILLLPENYCRIGNLVFSQTSIPKTKSNLELVKKLEKILNISVKPKVNKIVIYNKK